MKKQPKVLIIDDEADLRELLQATLEKMNIGTTQAENIQMANAHLEKQPFSLCLLDLKLPDGSGLDLLPVLVQKYPNMPVAIITAYGDMTSAITALKQGAFDFINKPIDLPILKNLVQSALKTVQLSHASTTLKPEHQLLGNSNAIKKLRQTLHKFAITQAPVHLYGPSGSGKELAAHLIHAIGARNDDPFIAVNCGAIPSELMESEFFGHKKGSFTDAHQDKPGLFQAADHGTLFLDEIAELPINMQVKLLRAIQEKTIRPIGSSEEIKVDVRILSASNQSLEQLVQTHAFRADLFYRIHVLALEIPALSDRKEDLPVLCDHILNCLANKLNTKPVRLSTKAMSTLKQYDFPGNIRELENILERAYALCEQDEITVQDLKLTTQTTSEKTPLTTHLEQVEKELILSALEKQHHNQTLAAKQLGITPRALRYRLKKLNIEK